MGLHRPDGEAIKRHNTATDNIRKDDSALNRRKSRLKKKAENESVNATKDPPAIKRRTGQLRRMSTYLRLDAKAEHRQLLEEIGGTALTRP